MGKKVDINEYNKGRKAGRNSFGLSDAARSGSEWMYSAVEKENLTENHPTHIQAILLQANEGHSFI